MTTLAPENANIAAVTEVVAAVERAQNNEDTEAFLNLFRADAIWTTGGGRLLIGRDAIAEFTRTMLPGAYGDSLAVMFVMTKEDGRWALTACQNTAVVDH